MEAISSALETRMVEKLRFLYGDRLGAETMERLRQLIAKYPIAPRHNPIDEWDVIVIAYGDHVRQPGVAPLETLHQFLKSYLGELVSAIHILPFFPFSSDDGFSVIDFRQVNPQLGDWSHIHGLRNDFELMFDLVLNHISASSDWFQSFLHDHPPYNDYFITMDPAVDLSSVVRPRPYPLLTPFDTPSGRKHVWTTFSPDQIDLNYKNPDVLLEIIETILMYIENGADYIRLDAVGFVWKQPGTPSIHLPQTHAIVRLIRDIVDTAAPWVVIITETNVPHKENITYFGDGHSEAQMIYQFALPALLLHSFHTGNAEALSKWAATLETPSTNTTFFNFTSSHDGIGVRPVTELLTPDQINHMINVVRQRGAQISYKSNPDGSKHPYEMNITYFDAIAPIQDNVKVAVQRFIVSQAIMLALAGVPGIYFPNLFGARNWYEGMQQTGKNRTINRQKFSAVALAKALSDPSTRESQIFLRYSELLRCRRTEAAFHPNSPQSFLNLHPSVFAIERLAHDGSSRVLAIHNVSNQSMVVDLPQGNWFDMITKAQFNDKLLLRPYQISWLALR